MEFLQLIIFLLLSVVAGLGLVYGLMRFVAMLTKESKGSRYKLVLKSTTRNPLPEIQATDFYKVLYQSDERYVLMVDRQSSPQGVVANLCKTYGIEPEFLMEENYLLFPPGGLF